MILSQNIVGHALGSYGALDPEAERAPGAVYTEAKAEIGPRHLQLILSGSVGPEQTQRGSKSRDGPKPG